MARDTETDMAANKNRLGRGLASLIGDLESEAASPEQVAGHRFAPIDALKASPYNPRRDFRDVELAELAESIREKGLVQPLIVRPAQDAGAFEIVAGERRWRAAQRAGLHQVPVIIRELSDQEALELAVIENVQRADLNAIEEARGYEQLIERFGNTQENLSAIVGKSRSHLANMLRLLKLPETVQALVEDGELSAGHARALVGRADAEALAKEIVRDGLTVRDVEALVQRAAPERKGGRQPPAKNADTRAAEAELAEAIGLAVTIRSGKGEKGEIRIRYASLDQFEAVRARLLKNEKNDKNKS